jgi:integrase
VLAQRKPPNPLRCQSFLVGPTITKGEKSKSVNRNKIGSMGIVSADSWAMRDLCDTRVKISRGLITIPKKLTAIGVKRLMERAMWAQGLRNELQPGKKRHPFPTNHSLRKYFKTRCELAGMKPINIENLMGHSTGISDSYYRPTENDLLEDYLKCYVSCLVWKIQ